MAIQRANARRIELAKDHIKHRTITRSKIGQQSSGFFCNFKKKY
jgi:hypothetical protein